MPPRDQVQSEPPARSTDAAGTAAHCRPTAPTGYTIIEVALAATIMALVIATSITTLQRGFLSLDTARNTVLAGQIMQSAIEKMRINNWAVIGAYPTGATAIPIDSSFTGSRTVGNRFALTRTVADIQTGTNAGLRSITFTATWQNYDGRSFSRSYTTYYAQLGLYDYFVNS